MTRQYYNYKICDIIFSELCPEFILIEAEVYHYVFNCSQQRFGQIICNYICPDYRYNTSAFTKLFMETIFPDNSDPFFEESKETYERLCKLLKN